MNSTLVQEQLLAEEEKKNRTISIIVTIVVHALILLFLWTLVIGNNPPMDPGDGIPVDFGTSEVGAGEAIPESTTPVEQQSNPTPTPAAVAPVEHQDVNDNKTITQDNEDAAAVKTSEKKNEVKPVKEEVKQPVKEAKKEAPVPEPPKPTLVKGATMGKPSDKNVKGNNGNDAPGTPGDKGELWGTHSKDNFKGPGGNGGDGPGSGDGPGHGPGHGPGAGGALLNRKVLVRPNLSGDDQDQGTVVVTLTVDASGTVTDVGCCAQGTTSSNEALKNKAIKESYKIKFSPGDKTQVGTWTFVFKLR